MKTISFSFSSKKQADISSIIDKRDKIITKYYECKILGPFQSIFKTKHNFKMRILSYFYVIDFFCCGISGSDITDLYEKLKNNYDIDIPGIDFWIYQIK